MLSAQQRRTGKKERACHPGGFQLENIPPPVSGYLTEPFFLVACDIQFSNHNSTLRKKITICMLCCMDTEPHHSKHTPETSAHSGEMILTECSKTHIKTELSKSCARRAQSLVTGSDMIIGTDGTEICSGKCKQDAFLWNCHVRAPGKTEPQQGQPTYGFSQCS